MALILILSYALLDIQNSFSGEKTFNCFLCKCYSTLDNFGSNVNCALTFLQWELL